MPLGDKIEQILNPIKINAVPVRAVVIIVGSLNSKTIRITGDKLTPNQKLQARSIDSLIPNICFVELTHINPKSETRTNKAPICGVTISLDTWMYVPRIHKTIDMERVVYTLTRCLQTDASR